MRLAEWLKGQFLGAPNTAQSNQTRPRTPDASVSLSGLAGQRELARMGPAGVSRGAEYLGLMPSSSTRSMGPGSPVIGIRRSRKDQSDIYEEVGELIERLCQSGAATDGNYSVLDAWLADQLRLHEAQIRDEYKQAWDQYMSINAQYDMSITRSQEKIRQKSRSILKAQESHAAARDQLRGL